MQRKTSANQSSTSGSGTTRGRGRGRGRGRPGVMLPRAFFDAAASNNGVSPPSPIQSPVPAPNASRGTLNSTPVEEDFFRFGQHNRQAVPFSAPPNQRSRIPVRNQTRRSLNAATSTTAPISNRVPLQQPAMPGPSSSSVAPPPPTHISSRRVQAGRIQKIPSPPKKQNKRTRKSPSSSSSSIMLEKLEIPKSSFARLLRSVLENVGNYRIDKDAVQKIHTASEKHLGQIFFLTNIFALHSKRVTIKQEDLNLTLRVLDMVRML